MEQPDNLLPCASEGMNKEENRLTKVTAQRLRDARKLCELSRINAAKRLGFADSQNLSKIENLVHGCDGKTTIPLSVVVQAARVYEVSTDYLLGLTDDWESDARLVERSMSLWWYEQYQITRTKELMEMAKLHRQLMIIGDQTRTLAKSVLNWVFRWENRELDKLEDVHFEMLKDEFTELADIASKARASMDKLKIPEIMDIPPHDARGTTSTNGS